MLAALHIASVAAMVAIKPRVSIMPRASPLPLRLALLVMAIVMSSRKGVFQLLELDSGQRRFFVGEGQNGAEVFVRPRNDLHADNFPDACCGGAAGIDGSLDCRHVADHQGRDHAAAYLLP